MKIISRGADIVKGGGGVRGPRPYLDPPLTPHKVQLRVKDGVRPKFCRTRQVPFALRATVDD